MFNYNSSINTGGFGAGNQGRIDTLRHGTSSLTNSLFGMSPYQRSRTGAAQGMEMQRNFQDSNRAARWNSANDLQRNLDASNQQLRKDQLSAATGNAMNAYDTADSFGRTRQAYGRQHLANIMATPLGQSLFGDL